MNEQKLSQGFTFLAEQGLNLVAVLDCATLPSEINQSMSQANIPLAAYNRFVLLGNGGRQFWQALQRYGLKTNDPVDYFSLEMSKRFIADYLDHPPVLMLYPGNINFSLQQLGTLAGWHHPSPLGLGINETYGLWFAYRVAFLTTLAIPLTPRLAGESPCQSCETKPCLAACPVGAVKQESPFGVTACTNFRLQPAAICQDRCLSRLACPVAPQHRYSTEQISYHYRHSLATIAVIVR